MASELLPCPFCAGSNLETYYADIEGWIAHIKCIDCDDMIGPMSEFKYETQEEAYEDASKRWNTRPTPVAPVSPDATGEPWPYQKTFNAIAAATRLESGCIFISVKDFVEAFGPTPDATGKCGELVTVLWGNARSLSQPHDPVVWERVCASYPRPYYTVELVTRSQAEELLAAERAEKEKLEAAWLETEGIISNLKAELAEALRGNRYAQLERIAVQRAEKAEADNVAQAARIKELENGLIFLKNWTNTKAAPAIKAIEAKLETYHEEYENRKEGYEKTINSLEEKLATAEKALEFYASRENWKNGRFEQAEGGTVLRHHPSSVHKDRGAKARAVLGGKS